MSERHIKGFDRHRAFIIAIDSYTNGIPSLRTPVSDGSALARLLGTQHGFEVSTLFDEAATAAGIHAFLAAMVELTGPEDRVVFYFAGHGVTQQESDGPQGYLLPQDADKVSAARYLSMSALSETLEQLRCRHVLVILDCCFAGAFRWASTRHLILAPGLVHEERYRWFIAGQAWQVLASTSPDERALDVASNHALGMRDTGEDHSPFALALLEGLAGAADLHGAGRRGDGVITVTELYLHIEDAFANVGRQAGPSQTPLLWPMKKHDKGQFVFLVPGREPELPPAPPLDVSRNPWRGLKPYLPEQAELFFGRSKVSQSLKQHFDGRSLTAVVGPSGIGKSSLVLAGLLPLLPDTVVVTLKPGARPLDSLVAAVGRPLSTGAELASALGQRLTGDTCQVVLIIDQLEELYTMSAESQRGDEFLKILADCLADTTVPLRIVCTLRSEFEPRLLQSPLAPHWHAARFIVPQMTQDELRRVVEGPASVRVLRFESEELVDRLINEVVQMPGALPLLSFALDAMFRSYLDSGREDREMTTAEFLALKGGVVGALQATADRLVAEMTPEQRATARRVLERLVSVEAGEFARRRVARSELLSLDSVEGGRVLEVLKRFDEARLIVSDDSGGMAQYELAHDSLTLSWQSLVGWVRDDAQRIFDLRRLTTDVELWYASGKQETGLLWSDDTRRAALVPLQREAFPGLNAMEREFVAASLRRAERIKRIRWFTAAALILLAVGATIAAALAWDRSQIAVSRQIAAQSTLAARENELSTALLLGVAAMDTRDTEQARAALMQTLLLAGHIKRLHRFTVERPNVVAMVGAERAAVGFRDGLIELHDFAPGKKPVRVAATDTSGVMSLAVNRETLFALHKSGVLAQISSASLAIVATNAVPDDLKKRLGNILETDEVAMAVSPDGGTLAIGGMGLHLFDIATRQWSVLPTDSKAAITRVKFPTGSNDAVALAWSDGRVEAVSIPTGSRLFGPFHDHRSLYMVQTFDPATRKSTTTSRFDAPVSGLDLSPDGTTMATGGDDHRVVLRSLKYGEIDLDPLVVAGRVAALAFDDRGLSVVSEGVAKWYDKGEKTLSSLNGVNAVAVKRMDLRSGSGRAAMLSENELVLWDWSALSAAAIARRADVSGMPVWKPDLDVTGIEDAIWLGDGSRTIVTASRDTTITVWRPGNPKASIAVPRDEPLASRGDLLMASHGRKVAIAGRHGIEFWSVPEQGIPLLLPGRANHTLPGLLALAFASDGSRLLAASSTGIHSISLADGSLTSAASVQKAEDAVISRDGSTAALASASAVYLLSFDGGELFSVPQTLVSIAPRVALSGDGSILAIDHRTYVEIWKVGATLPLRRIETGGKDWIVRSVELSPDGRLLAVWESDLGKSLWSVETGALLYRLRNTDICCANRWAFDVAGEAFAEVGPTGVTIWDLSPRRLKEAACSIVGRSLTEAERMRYISGVDVASCK